ncbi:hypothetical protein GYH30_047605 [Glycine max]|nr:hypothetical protein GYH30_047605 [Glycine max]
MAKRQNQTQTTQAKHDFRNNLPSASCEDGEVVHIVRPMLVFILTTEVCLKDKEPKVHIKHFLDIESLENAGYVIKAPLMLCGIHNFFENLEVVVLELICELWRTDKVYRNEVIGGYFVGKFLGISVKQIGETIPQAIGCKR